MLKKSLFSKTILESYLATGDYTPDEIARVKEEAEFIYSKLTQDKTPHHRNAKTKVTLVVGPYASGKSTLVHTLGLDNPHSVMVDNDMICQNMHSFQTDLYAGIDATQNFEIADKAAWEKWNNASVCISKWVMNRLQEEGYDIIRQAPTSTKTTKEIFSRAEIAKCDLTTIAVYAPCSVCEESLRRRIDSGGHPTGKKSMDLFFENLIEWPWILSPSNHLKFYWRPEVDKGPTLVGEVNAGKKLIVHNQQGLEAMNDHMVQDYVNASNEVLSNSILQRCITAIENKNVQRDPFYVDR